MSISALQEKKEYVDNHIELFYQGKENLNSLLARKRKPLKKIIASGTANKLYFGNNLDVLCSLYDDINVRGKVNLIYIDPPFATQRNFSSRKQQHAYSDNLVGADFVEYLRKRLILLKELLSEQGSIYLHLDEKMLFEMKLIMDEVFGSNNYKNIIIRKKCNPKNYTKKTYGNVSDFILFYTKTDNYIWNRPVTDLSEQSLKEYRYIEKETGRRYMKVPIHAQGTRQGETGNEWRGMLPPEGKHWQYKPSILDEMDAKGEIVWSKNGNPRRKVYLDANTGVGIQDIWLDFKDPHNQNIKITGYPTEKNPELLARIIQASSNEGDIVLDCFAGSGTTLAVSELLNRTWIGVDNSKEAIKTIVQRLRYGTEKMGDFVKKDKIMQSTLFDLFNNEDNVIEHNKKTEFSAYSFIDNYDDISNIFE